MHTCTTDFLSKGSVYGTIRISHLYCLYIFINNMNAYYDTYCHILLCICEREVMLYVNVIKVYCYLKKIVYYSQVLLLECLSVSTTAI